MDRPFIVSVLGWSGSGKTLFIERAIGELARRGIPCAAAKATRHGGDFEPPGKDSARFRAAGAAATAFIGTGEGGLTVRFAPSPPAPDRAYLEALFPGAVLILAEGLEPEGSFVVLVDGPPRAEASAAAPGGRGDGGKEPKRTLSELDLLVTEDPSFARRARDAGLPALAPGDTAAFIDLLEEAWKGT
jgi:molybdopterin-guanine dinucleotide biosynthesis protein MobB